MNLRIIKAGILDTVQDTGRYGGQDLGINPGGAMDTFAARIANILVGNDQQEAVIELHFPAAAFFFELPALIAVSGADFIASVNGEEVPVNQPILLSKFSILQFHGIKDGARAYLAVHGGLDVQQWLNSYSTHLKAAVGGFHGRALQKDDEIALKSTKDLCPLIGQKEFQVLPWKADDNWRGWMEKDILILPGNEWDRLTDISKEKLLQHPFYITPQSDRMGYRLQSDPLLSVVQEEIISSPVNFGTVQLLPDGQLIVLMADHQTAGGYPRVAHVITACHSRLAQLKPGEAIRFRVTNIETAEALLVQQEQHLLQLQNACQFKLEQLLHAY
jgi:antagonist of KipI